MTCFSRVGLVARSLRYYWRSNLAVALGVAVAVAVLVGSLLVGDSVRGSLRDLALERLGRTDYALLSPTFFSEQLAADLLKRSTPSWPIYLAAPAIIVNATAKLAGTEVVVPKVTVLAVDDRFWKLGSGGPPAALAGRDGLLNQNLAKDLGAGEGDAVLLSIGKRGAAPVDSAFGRRGRRDTVSRFRVRVIGVAPAAGLGRFSLRGDEPRPRNVYVSLAWLQKQLGREGRVNTVLVASPEEGGGSAAKPPRLSDLVPLTCEDYGLRLVPSRASDYYSLESEELVLPGAAVRAALAAARGESYQAALTSVYLANSLTLLRQGGVGPSVPYSVVAGLEAEAPPPLGPLVLAGGGPTPELGPQDMILSAWAADDLGARVGDRIEMACYVAGGRGELTTQVRTFTLRGIVGMEGLAVDPGLVPAFEGITDAKTMGDWDPPFPIDLTRIRPKDEDYWQRYRTAPKAFISLETARSLWLPTAASSSSARPSTRNLGRWVTSVRLAPADGQGLSRGRLEGVLLAQLDPEEFGLTLRPVKAEALASSQGSTDFGVLFLSMSMFLVVAAAALVGLLLRLTAERRAGQYGILLATGFTTRSAARMLMAEGMLLALGGVVAGVPLGVGYGWAIIGALGRWWQGAVGEFTFTLHVQAASLLIGSLGGLAVAALAIWWATRLLRRTRAVMLLAGWRAMTAQPSATVRRRALAVGVVAMAVALVLLVLSGVFGVVPETGAFFGGASALLVGCLALAAAYLQRPGGPARERPLTLFRLAVRGASRNWVRSLLTMGLLACASFLVVAVAANRRDLTRMDTSRRDSGAGGFTLLARSALPIYVDLNTEAGREALAFAPGASDVLRGTHIAPFPVNEGDDISCLNVQRPQTPRVLGVPRELIERGGFRVSKVLSVKGRERGTSNPWELLNADLGEPGVVPAFADAASAQWILHLGLGEEVEVPGNGGRPVRLRLVGMLANSVFASELLVSERNFKEHLAPGAGYRFFLIETPPGKEGAVMKVLRENLGELGFDVTRTADVLAGYARVQNTYLATFQTLGGLGLLLGTFGMVTVLLRGVVERRSELAMMLSLGFRRRQLMGIVLLENGVLLLVGLAVGTVCALVSVAPHLGSALADVQWLSLVGVLFACVLVGLASCALASGLSVRAELLSALRAE